VSEFYFESRYPLDYEVDYTREQIEEALNQARAFIALIWRKTDIE
jgi:hypothetical protein